nr:MAG TPA_asm: hypothetical protein [Bacteriophage sp.]
MNSLNCHCSEHSGSRTIAYKMIYRYLIFNDG